ncbi:hypothetical protein AGMMS50239_29990 [Bacteroidia bacterium]|nr:hypothetical protein AGMMS50239_29990 [Bacteroidia bacterium]
MKITNKLILIVTVFFWIISTLTCFSQEDKDRAFQDFDVIETENRYVESLKDIEGTSYNLPVGIKKIIGNIPVILAVSNVKIGSQYGECSIYLKIELPSKSTDKKSNVLIFGAQGVKISYGGDLAGDIKLLLISSHTLPLGNLGSIEFKGGGIHETTGNQSSETFATLDCNGDFKELALSADLIFNKNTFESLAAEDGILRSGFRLVMQDLNDLLVNINIPDFKIKGVPDFVFSVSEATIDLSDSRNPVNFKTDPEYFAQYFTLPDPNLWRGVYISKLSVTFPSMFNRKDSQKSTVEASNFIIDEAGITGDISGTDILSFEQGDAGGSPFSVTGFKLSFLANNIKGFGFGGQMAIPFLTKEKPRSYTAYISKDEYLFNVTLGNEESVNLLGMGNLHLEPTSVVQVKVKDGKFLPAAILDGEIKIDIDGLKLEQLAFTKLRLSAEDPHFSVESAKYGGEVKFYNFPLSIDSISFSSKGANAAVLGFNLNLNLMDGKISARSGLRMTTEFKGHNEIEFKGVQVDRIRLEKIQLAGFSLDGEINIVKDDPVYGNYLGGEIIAAFDALSDGLKVGVKSVFGYKDFRYWYVEGMLKSGSGIPVGPLFLNGFVGGAYYKMQFTGGTGIRSYSPYEDCGLGVKAGINYYVAQENTISGNALFEMNFSSSGGIRNMMFYGTAEFLKKSNKSENDLNNMFTSGQGKVRCPGQSFTAGMSPGSDGSSMSKEVLSGMNLSGIISAYLYMNYEFTTKTFDANFAVLVNTPGNILRGAGNNGEAGWAFLHISPQSWFIHVGTPSNPLGLKLGLGPLSLSTESYFMLGDKLEAPILDPNVARILNISPEQADYMKYPHNITLGKGVAFGSRFKFDTGNLSFLILYARFMAGTGFDVMLQDLSGYSCKGKSETIGLDGWYANGQSYVYLEGDLGVRIKLVFINKSVSIIHGSAATLLQARLPNPTWIGGYMAVDLDVLGGLIKANMKMKFSFGDACEIVRNDGDYTPLDFPIIADLTPKDGESEVDIFLSPQATFNMQLEESFDAQDDQGNTHTYRIRIEDFYIADNGGTKVAGVIKKGKNMDASFASHDVLPPYKDMQAFVSVNFEELAGGRWTTVMQNGKPARETKTVKFKTGEAPNYIPASNIEYCYPVIAQKNFYKSESTAGYIQLVKGQPYLFPGGFNYDVTFSSAGRQDLKAGFEYNAGEKRLSFSIPALANRTDYTLAFVASKEGGIRDSGVSTITSSATIQGEEGESYTVDYMQQAAQKIIKEGSLKVLDYNFATSNFNTFEQKMSSLSLSRGAFRITQDVHALYLNTGKSYERFDEAEVEGVQTTGTESLVRAEAILEDAYYREVIYPLLYKWYPIPGISIQNRNVNEAGLPPVKGFSVLDGYFSGNIEAQKAVPFVYNLVYYYNKDFVELRSKAANMFDKGINMEPLMPLVTSQFPLIREGEYKTLLRYVMPGAKQGTQKQVNYIYWY